MIKQNTKEKYKDYNCLTKIIMVLLQELNKIINNKSYSKNLNGNGMILIMEKIFGMIMQKSKMMIQKNPIKFMKKIKLKLKPN